MVMVNVRLGWRQRLAVLQYQRGLLFIQRMAYLPAIAAFDRALRWHPNPAEVYVMRGTAHSHIKDLVAALADYDQAIALVPEHRRAHSKRGLLRYQQGDEAGALADWEIALSGKPLGGTAQACFARALLHGRRQEKAAARRDLDLVITIDPNHALAYFHRGNLRQTEGDLQGAVRDWELAVANDFSLDEAKLKLQAVERSQNADALADQIAERLQGLFEELKVTSTEIQLQVKLEFKAPQLIVQVHRPLGLAVNYGHLAETIRMVLMDSPQQGISRFRMELYTQGSRFLNWSQSEAIYRNQPCPSSHWRFVALTTILAFPVGIPAAVFAWRTEQLFEDGHYREAQQTSKTALGLCRLGMGLAAVMAIAAASYAIFAITQPERQLELESARAAQNCTEHETEARCVNKQRSNHRPGY